MGKKETSATVEHELPNFKSLKSVPSTGEMPILYRTRRRVGGDTGSTRNIKLLTSLETPTGKGDEKSLSNMKYMMKRQRKSW